MSFTPYRGDRYLSWDEVVAFCTELAAASPELVELQTLAHTREGRPLLLLTLGDRSGTAPAFWLDAGTHATEWTGVMSTLYSMSAWLGDARTVAWLRHHTVYVMPCLSPDGFHSTFTTGEYVRSTHRPPPEGTLRRGWEHRDLDGDGVVRWMRWRHPAGPWIIDPAHPFAIRSRTLDDDPADAWMIVNEGRFVAWDGVAWVDAPYEHGLDLNRNFPGSWAPFSMFGMDGGLSPMSEVESRTTVDAFRARPNVSVAVTNHTFTGALLTQPYVDPSPLGATDIRVMHGLATDAVKDTGWRVFKTNPEFMYDPKKPIVGVWADTMATLFGVAGYTLELWDPWAHAGMEVKDPARFFQEPDAAGIAALLQKMAEESGTKAWAPFRHPQLGLVELGGIDPFRTVSNPPVALLAETCERAFRIHDRARRALPDVAVSLNTTKEGDCTVVEVVVENHGHLGTGGLERAHTLGLDPGVRLELVTEARLVSGDPVQVLPPLPGWGVARAAWAKNPLWPDLGDVGPRAVVRWVVRGDAPISVRWWTLRGGRGEVASGG